MRELSFAPIFGNGMVFQREKEIRIWGYAEQDEQIVVSFAGQRAECQVVDKKWTCRLQPLSVMRGQTLSVCQGNQKIILKDISVGDVWVAAGQSNMEFFLSYEAHCQEALSMPDNPDVHMYNCPRIAFNGQKLYQDDSGKWFGLKDAEVLYFSAIGHWFAREIQPYLQIPVGIIGCNWGGTSASAWTALDELKQSPLDIYITEYEAEMGARSKDEIEKESEVGWKFQYDKDHLNEWAGVMHGISRREQVYRVQWSAASPVVPVGPYNKNRPGGLFLHMVSQITSFPVKGILWYQGENDVCHSDLYDRLFTTLIRCWRQKWEEELPFLFVQLAPFERWMSLDGSNFPEIRRRQEIVSAEVPNCWMTTSMDVGMRYDIHPKEKKVLAHRLVLLALDKVYGVSCLSDPPQISKAERKGSYICLKFIHIGSGLHASSREAKNFSLEQNGRHKEILNLNVCGDCVTLHVKDLEPDVLRISFAQRPNSRVLLRNEAGIPAKPFIIEI